MKKNIKVFASVHPFGETDVKARQLITEQGWKLILNPYKRKITAEELKKNLSGIDALIAGTEKLNTDTLKFADNLKFISRAGIGLDGIDWDEIKKRGIEVAYTPGASTESVAELALGFMLSLVRQTFNANNGMHNGVWQRYIGRELAGMTIGVIGLGRIGKTIVRMLKPFGCRILVNDIAPDRKFIKNNRIDLTDKKKIYRESDLITFHVPLTRFTSNMINSGVFRSMKKGSFLVNTSRGPVVNEDALYKALKDGRIKGAALDVYNEEPYRGKLSELNNIILTSHMGSCTDSSRRAMEIGAAQAVLNFFTGKKLKNRVPDELRKEL